VWLATAPSLVGVTEKYFAHRKAQVCEFSRDHNAVAALEEIGCKL
jgi:hypothetical protein